MLLDTGCIIPIEEARRDFSQVIRLADRFGAAVIIQDAPWYLVRDLSREENQRYLAEIKETIDNSQ